MELASKRKSAATINFILRAFRHRNYRLFFTGQAISLIGIWMQQIAISWLVYRITGSTFYLGFVGFLSQAPSLISSPFAGVFADKMNRKKLMILSQICAMFHAMALASLTLSGHIRIWHIFALGIFLGLVHGVEMPLRQSFVVDLIEDRNDLPNAIALNSFMFNGARIIGPSIAGIIISAFGEGICFLINGFSFLAIIFTLLRINPKKQSLMRSKEQSFIHDFKEGFSYSFKFPPIRYIILLLALTTFMGMPYVVLMPAYAREVLYGGPKTLGFLMSASGLGAVFGAIYLASRRSVIGLGRLIGIASSLFGLGLFTLSLSKHFLFSIFIMPFVGFGVITQTISSNTVIQLIVDEDKRGRVMSLYTMSFMGMLPFGSLLAGSTSSHIGILNTLRIGGMVCLLGSIFFFTRLPLIRKHIRPIYVNMGIIKEHPSPEGG